MVVADLYGSNAAIYYVDTENGKLQKIDTKLEEVKGKLLDGSLQVFDAANFTVEGKKLDSYKADVDNDANFEKDTEVIENGVFYESKHRSAPYFDVRIDGITLLDEAY